MEYSLTRRILRSLMTPNWADPMLLAVERRALRLLIPASWAGFLVVVEDVFDEGRGRVEYVIRGVIGGDLFGV